MLRNLQCGVLLVSKSRSSLLHALVSNVSNILAMLLIHLACKAVSSASADAISFSSSPTLLLAVLVGIVAVVGAVLVGLVVVVETVGGGVSMSPRLEEEGKAGVPLRVKACERRDVKIARISPSILCEGVDEGVSVGAGGIGAVVEAVVVDVKEARY